MEDRTGLIAFLVVLGAIAGLIAWKKETVFGWARGAKEYFLELRTEMGRVTWPSKKQVQATTLVVIVTVFAFAAYFAVVDQVFSVTIGRLFTVFAR